MCVSMAWRVKDQVLLTSLSMTPRCSVLQVANLDYSAWGCSLNLTARFKSISPPIMSVFELGMWTLSTVHEPMHHSSLLCSQVCLGLQMECPDGRGSGPNSQGVAKGPWPAGLPFLLLLLYLAMVPFSS